MISVLIATRNRGPELETQLRSFEAMEDPRGGWELLVINNGPSDETTEILWRIAAEGHLPLRPLSEPRRGKSRALNLGMLAARGELFAFTDDDASLGFALRWAFWNGRSNARIAGFPAGVPTVARVPRYLYGSMLREAPRAVLSLFSSRVDFPGGHRLAYELGLAYEFRRLPRDFDPGAQVPPWGRTDDPREPIAQTRV